jgi:hypothetical protein
MSEYLVVEGFGDFISDLDSCDSVKIVRRFASEVEAVAFAADYYESAIWGEDSDGFSMTDDARMAFFTLVRTSEELPTLA